MITIKKDERFKHRPLTINDELIEQLTGHDLSFIAEASYEGVAAIHSIPGYENLTFDERWEIVEKTVKNYLKSIKHD